MIRRILIPTDGSAYSRTSCEYGIYLSRLLEATVTGLFVLDLKILKGPLFNDIAGFVDFAPCEEFIPLLETGLSERADSILSDFQKHCRQAGIRTVTKKVSGLIDETIIIEGAHADLIILAQRGEHFSLTTTGLLGSTSEAVVRKSGTPVMITPLHFREIDNMAIAFDGRHPSIHALEFAVRLAEATRRPLAILIVADDAARTDRMKTLASSSVAAYDVAHTIVTRRGKEEQQILRFCEEGHADLIIMGAYGKSRFRELIVGSTTSYVIRKSTVPVILVR